MAEIHLVHLICPNHPMHPKIRKIIDTTPYTQATMREAGKFLPADDAEFDRWVGDAVARRESLDFFTSWVPGWI